MGFGSYCQICGNQLPWTTLVPHDGVYLIWRGCGEDNRADGKTWMDFGADHEWLKRVVCLKAFRDPETNKLLEEEQEVIQGGVGMRVVDGDIIFDDGREDMETGIAEDLYQVRAAAHEACWRICSEPNYTAIVHIQDSDAYDGIGIRFHHQYFMFSSMNDNEKFWLIDPELDSDDGRINRERIKALFGIPAQEAREQKIVHSSEAARNTKPALKGPTLPEGFDGMTLYNLLGIPANTTQEEVGKALRRQMKRHHPNTPGGGNPVKYNEARKAHYILGNE